MDWAPRDFLILLLLVISADEVHLIISFLFWVVGRIGGSHQLDYVWPRIGPLILVSGRLVMEPSYCKLPLPLASIMRGRVSNMPRSLLQICKWQSLTAGHNFHFILWRVILRTRCSFEKSLKSMETRPTVSWLLTSGGAAAHLQSVMPSLAD